MRNGSRGGRSNGDLIRFGYPRGGETHREKISLTNYHDFCTRPADGGCAGFIVDTLQWVREQMSRSTSLSGRRHRYRARQLATG